MNLKDFFFGIVVCTIINSKVVAQNTCFPDYWGPAELNFSESRYLNYFFYAKQKTNVIFNFDSLQYRCCQEFISELEYLHRVKSVFKDSARFYKFRDKWHDYREIEKLKFFELIQKITKYGPVELESKKPCKYTVVVFPIFIAPSLCENKFDNIYYAEGNFRVIGYETQNPQNILFNCLITKAFGVAGNVAGWSVPGLAREIVEALKGNDYEKSDFLNSIKESYAVAAKKLMLYLREEHRKGR